MKINDVIVLKVPSHITTGGANQSLPHIDAACIEVAGHQRGSRPVHPGKTKNHYVCSANCEGFLGWPGHDCVFYLDRYGFNLFIEYA